MSRESDYHIGQVGGSTNVVEITLTLDTNAYADGDVLAATQTISNAARIEGKTVIWGSMILLDKDDQGGALDILILRTNVSIGSENSTVSVSDANADEIAAVCEVSASDYVDLINSQIVYKKPSDLGFAIDPADGSRDLYVAAISRDSKTYTANGITLKLGFFQD